MGKKVQGYIRIIKIPAGEAPLSIRRAWVGLILPCDPICGFPTSGGERGALTGKESSHNRYGFSVLQEDAIEILEWASTEVAKWWWEHGYPKPDQYFGFAEDEAEIVGGVTHQQIVHVPDGEGGDPNR